MQQSRNTESCEEGGMEVSTAASILLSISQAILDPIEARILQDKKKETLSKIYSSIPEGYSFDGIKLPERPPGQTIQTLISGDKISPPFEKQITDTDTKKTQSRIILKKSSVEQYYLNMLGANAKERLKVGIKVTTYGPDGKGFDMNFKTSKGAKFYYLDNGWHDFCKEYKLEPWINWATIWMFIDKHGGICFAITWKTNHSTTEWVGKSKRKRP